MGREKIFGDTSGVVLSRSAKCVAAMPTKIYLKGLSVTKNIDRYAPKGPLRHVARASLRRATTFFTQAV